MADTPENSGKPHYRWPYFLLAAVILAIVLAVVWVSFAVKEVRERRVVIPEHSPARTNAVQ